MFPLHEPPDETIREALRAYDDLTAALLARRGIATSSEAEAFLDPSYDRHIGDPLLILNMPVAARRVADAIVAGERITVWSDYDCDGIPGGALLHDFLAKAGANFDNYIPHRHEEGYGLNVTAIEKLAAAGTKVLVTVDCGIVDVAQVARARELGIDVIVTDHHLPGPVLPPALAVIDPKQDGETYSFKEFCGGGLAWKLACAVLAVEPSLRQRVPDGWEKWLLDMAGLSTIADMVPLVGENRVIAKYGLLVMRKSPRIGFQKLCRSARVNQRLITEDDVGFMIAPRVNAASRMGNPRDAFELFTTTDEARADVLAKELERVNRSRRSVAASITRAVKERIEARRETGTLPSVIAMGDPDWRPGLLGLVANSVAEEYGCSVFLWGREATNTIKGSCRAGSPALNVVELMRVTEDTFIEFGGHAAAGGFSVREDTVFFLEEHLNAAVARMPAPDALGDVLSADALLPPADATRELLSRLERLAPFGMGNPKPVFRILARIGAISWFGKSGEHLRLTVTDESSTQLEAIAFYGRRMLGDVCDVLAAGQEISILGSLERDQFSRGQPVRLRLVRVAR